MAECPMPEAWLPVVGYEGYYEVSSLGRVRSIPRTIWTRLGRSQRLKGVELRQTASGRFGVVTVKLSKDHDPQSWKVSWLVAYAFHGPRPDGLVVRHLNDVQADNRVSNLVYGTSSENMADMLRNGHNWGANKLVCPRGHKLVEPNLVARYLHGEGRTCLACARAHTWVWNHPEDDLIEQANLYYEAIMTGEPLADRAPRFDEVNASKTHCIRGHALSGLNLRTVVRSDGTTYRNCRSCVRAVEKVRIGKEPESRTQELADHYYVIDYGGTLMIPHPRRPSGS